MENIFKEFNEGIFSCQKEITWYDEEGIYDLDVDRFVIIRISERGTKDNYVGHYVEVYNRKDGLIVKKFFHFENHIEFIRRDSRQKYYHAWLNDNKIDWYIDRPKHFTYYVRAIMDFLQRVK